MSVLALIGMAVLALIFCALVWGLARRGELQDSGRSIVIVVLPAEDLTDMLDELDDINLIGDGFERNGRPS